MTVEQRGFFVSFEGGDGAGKGIQISELARRCEQNGIDYIVTREPGGTGISEQIRQILLDPDNRELTGTTEALLYAASRAQHVELVIKPALAEGKLVICDRYVDSSVAYQTYGLGLSLDAVQEINRFATGGLVPDRTYMLQISPEEGERRASARGPLDRIEQRQKDYQDRVYKGFGKIAKANKRRILLLDAGRSISDLASTIWVDFSKSWNKRDDCGGKR